MTTKIEWTGETWNFLGGCDEISPGCVNCYAKYIAHRLAQNPNKKIAAKYRDTTKVIGVGETKRVVWTAKMNFDEENLIIPLKTKKPTTYFISMSDLFYEEVKDEWIDKAFAVMALAKQHTFQVLTKRAQGMRDYFASVVGLESRAETIFREADAICRDLKRLKQIFKFPLPNVWLGVSVENQKAADERIPYLLETPAAVRFLSCEPLLGEVDLNDIRLSDATKINSLRGFKFIRDESFRDVETYPFEKIDWVIVGGESGARARPFYLEHGLDIIRQCQNAGVPAFFKQAGAFCVTENVNLFDFPDSVEFREWGNRAASWRIKFKDKKGGDLADIPEELRIRELSKIQS